MLRKCLRYDFKSVFTYWIFGAITLILLSIPAGLAVKSQSAHANDVDHFNWEPLAIALFYFAIAAFILLSAILIYCRYYNHFFTDEGYLTFTLPVKRRTLYTSKVLTGVIFQALTTVVALLSYLIFALFLPSTNDSSDIINSEPIMSGFWSFMCVLGGLAFAIIYSFASVMAIYLVITFCANSIKKNKVIATVGVFYAAYIALSIISYILVVVFIAYGAAAIKVVGDAPSNLGLFIFLLIALADVVLTLISVAFAMITLNIIERKLNLS